MISSFDQNFDFWPIFGLLTTIVFFDQIFDQNLTKESFSMIPSFDQNFDFSQKNWLLRKFRLFPRFRLWINISTFAENLDFLQDFGRECQYLHFVKNCRSALRDAPLRCAPHYYIGCEMSRCNFVEMLILTFYHNLFG